RISSAHGDGLPTRRRPGRISAGNGGAPARPARLGPGPLARPRAPRTLARDGAGCAPGDVGRSGPCARRRRARVDRSALAGAPGPTPRATGALRLGRARTAGGPLLRAGGAVLRRARRALRALG